MPDRLSSVDLTFLAAESAAAPMHVGTVDIFEPPKGSRDGFDYESLVALIRDRIAFVPRYRQRVQHVPGHFAAPVWVDDEEFDITFHVRRSALPRPGTHEQLLELVARIMSRRLDRARPLWEMYLVEGLSGGRFAILSKSHQALVDGSGTVDIGQVVLDSTAHPRETPPDSWQPQTPPSALELLAGVFADAMRSPTAVLELARAEMASLTGSTSVREAVGDLLGSAVVQRRAQENALHTKTTGQRRFTTVKTALDDFRAVRAMHGGTVNDVILAVVAGALRSWMLTRGESVSAARAVRAVVPLSIRDDGEGEQPSSLGSRVIASTVNLPIGENSSVMRLHQISYQTKVHKDTGRAVSARSLVGIAGFAPTTFHALAARVATASIRPTDDVVISNVPGPQFPLFAHGARMLASFPVVPLTAGQSLAVGATSYDGNVWFGLNADRTAVPDLRVFAQCITDALDELLDTTKSSRTRAPRGRSTPSPPATPPTTSADADQEVTPPDDSNEATIGSKLAGSTAQPRAKGPKATSEEVTMRKKPASRKPSVSKPSQPKSAESKLSAKKVAVAKSPGEQLAGGRSTSDASRGGKKAVGGKKAAGGKAVGGKAVGGKAVSGKKPAGGKKAGA